MKGFCLQVNGSYALFTRPEMKVERVSYDVITPSAARAIFESILWKPAIRWRVTRIEVLSPIRWISVRRNEVGKVASPRSDGIVIEDDRQQRAGLLLRDVSYRLYAEFDFIPPERRAKVQNPMPEWLVDSAEAEALKQPDVRQDETEAKYAAMFDRRATKGQTFNQPYFGCREFACEFKLVRNSDRSAAPPPIEDSRDLGWLLFDLDYTDANDPQPMWFRPRIENGVIAIPHPDSEEVRR